MPQAHEPGGAADDDAALVREFLARRAEAVFRRLYTRHTPAMFGLAMRLSGGRQDEAEDAVQEAWIRAVERLPAFRGESALRTWLCGITVNCARERLRAAWLSEGEVPESATAPAADERLTVEQLLYRLPAGYRAVLVLHDVEGYTHREIAVLLGIEEGTAKSQLSRARRTMRAWLASRTQHAPAR